MFAQFVFNLESLKMFLCWLRETNRKGERGWGKGEQVGRSKKKTKHRRMGASSAG